MLLSIAETAKMPSSACCDATVTALTRNFAIANFSLSPRAGRGDKRAAD
jgi:hypothetical protein